MFANFTREDWKEIDRLRALAFEPTLEELQAEYEKKELERINIINTKLSNLGIIRPEIITKERTVGLLNNLNAQEFVGSDISGWVDRQTELYGSLESAFEDLVVRYL